MWGIRVGVLAWGLSACSCGKGGGGGDDDDDVAPDASANVRIDGAEGSAPDPTSVDVRLCATDDGAVIVAWSDDRDGVQAVWARRSPDAGVTWPDPPVRFGDPGAAAEHPELACAGAGAVLVWEDQRDGDLARPTVYASSSADGGASWSAAAAVAGTDGTLQQLGSAVAAAGAEVAVAWYGDDNGSYDVFVARSSDLGQTWEPPVRVDSDAPGSAWSAHPTVALRAADEVLVAWEDRRAGLSDVYAAASHDGGGGFAVDARLDDGDAGSYAPALLVSGADAVDVAWHDRRDGEAYEAYLAHSADGGRTWAPPLRLSAGEPAGTVDAVLPRLAAGDDGVLHAVFYAASGGGYHVQHRALVDGVPTGAPTTVDHAPAVALARYPALAVAGADLVVAWQDDRDAAEEGQGDLYYTFSADEGATFAPADHRIDARAPGGPVASGLAIALRDRVLLAAWTDARDGTEDVWFARLPLGASAPSP